MAYNRENYIRLKSEFEQKYRLAHQSADERKAECERAIPELTEIDRALYSLSLAVVSESMKGKNGLDERIAALKSENANLRSDREQLLLSHGYPSDYLDVKYECPICGDTGFVDNHICTCFKKALIKAGYQSSGIGKLIETQSFDNFSLDYYSSSEEERKSMVKVFEHCKKYAENFPDNENVNLLLFGKTGLGKTHISTSIAKTVIDRGYDVTYETAMNMFNDYADVQFNHTSSNIVNKYTECELLIVDDLGTEITNQFIISTLYNIINTRINQGSAMIVNTNLTFEELGKRYGDRLFSRLIGEFAVESFVGRDIRFQKLMNN